MHDLKSCMKKVINNILIYYVGQEKEDTTMDDKWMSNAIKSMKLASPTSLKITLRSVIINFILYLIR